MSIFPNLDTTYASFQTDDDQEIKRHMEESYLQAHTYNQSFWAEASIDTRFHAGDQSVFSELYGFNSVFNRKQFNFNRIRPTCNLVEGYQRENRKNSVVIPIEDSDQKTADQLSGVLTWSIQKENALETLSQAFSGAAICGMNLLSLWMDYRADPINGDVKVDNTSFNSYLIDPFFRRKYDLSDCNYIWTRKYLTVDQACSLFYWRKNDIKSLPRKSNKDGKFYFMPESYNFQTQNLLTYDEFWYRDFRKQKLLVDTETGETMEWEKEDDLLQRFLRKHPNVKVTENIISCAKLAIVIQGQVFYNGENPMGIDEYPFVPVFFYYSPEISAFPYRLSGIVRGMRDAQYLYNHRKVVELDIVESQITSGFKYKPSALIDPKDIHLTGQGKGLALTQEAQMTDVEKIMPPDMPASLIELSRILGEEIKMVSGINEELLGAATDDKPGILSMLRQGAGLMTLRTVFDQLDHSQARMAYLMVRLIQANFSPGKVRKILNEDPTPQFYSKSTGKFDIAIEDGVYSTTQKQVQFQQMLELMQAGVPIDPVDLLKASTVQRKDEIIQNIEMRQQQQSQQVAQEQEIAYESARASIKESLARAEANRGLGLERASRVQENRAFAVERLDQAHRDRSAAALDDAKTAKEIESMEYDQIEKGMGWLNYLKQNDTQESEEKEQVKSPNVEELATVTS